MPDKIKVLFIISTLQRMGGAEKNLCDIIGNINALQFRTYIVALQGGGLSDRLRREGFDVYDYGISKLLTLHALRKAWKLRRFILKAGIDIIVTYHHDADIWGYFVSKAAGGLPVISSRRDMGFQLTAKHIWFYRIFGNRFEKMITVSDAVQNEIARREWIRHEKMVTIHNGLDPARFMHSSRSNEIREELCIPLDSFIIGSVASFRPIKGQIYLVEAMRQIVNEYPNAHAVIVGYKDTEYFQRVNIRVQELGLSEHITFAGARQDVPDLLSAFDVFVISSVNEGFSNAIIEAMAAGKPVIAANSGGNPEAVKNGVTGLLFSPCNSRSLAEKTCLLIKEPDRRRTMGQNGLAAVERRFHLNSMIQKTEKLIKGSVCRETKN